MKITSILTLAAALCAVSVNAAELLPKPTPAPSKAVLSHPQTTAVHHHPTVATAINDKKTTKKSTKKPTKGKPTPTPTKVPPKLDACGLLAKQAQVSGSSLSYDAVKGCFEAQTFKPDVADKVLTSLENVLGNFYVFLDQAKAGPNASAGSPLLTPTVDVMQELNKIRQKKDWKSDYEFQMALSYLTSSLNDGHLAYQSDCYRTVTFQQPLSLYAPVVNGAQSVRVFFVDTSITQKGLPKNPSSLNDCNVLTIDGQPALQAIQKFTDRSSAISKDPGVRLNDALASTSWYTEWSSSPGGFASRWEVPDKASMDYTIQCDGDANVQSITVPWTIKPSDMFESDSFKNAKTYWEVQCSVSGSFADSAKKNLHNKRQDSSSDGAVWQAPRRGDSRRILDGGASTVAPATAIFHRRGEITEPKAGPSDSSRGGSTTSSTISHAKLVHTSSTTAFYMLLGANVSNTCVAVIASEDAADFNIDSSDYTDLIKGFQILQDQGCVKLIFDMTNNGGGSVDFAYFVNQLFFPDAKPYFVEDLRDNSLVQAASKQAIKYPKAHSMFDARIYNSMATGRPYKDASMFLKGVNQKRGGSTVTFTQKNYFPYSWPFLPLAKGKALKFTPQNMAIITNGFCGSACTMIASRFAIVHNVKTYAIGGITQRPLSYFSFPGGFVSENAGIVADLASIHLKNASKTAPIALPIMGTTSLPVGELYALENSTMPLEYDSQYFAAAVHLDQDPVSARHPDQVWLKIARDFANTSTKKTTK
ncbi:hypothetical protein EDD21DRAFT_86681 [Dissophora ornata]|nr:hypothetical protein BGZ58_003033 [Dissophora ornata]KAI8602118.1 hypothetical protein EDD21DRAFT_86681 [Dissophora ornata]